MNFGESTQRQNWLFTADQLVSELRSAMRVRQKLPPSLRTTFVLRLRAPICRGSSVRRIDSEGWMRCSRCATGA